MRPKQLALATIALLVSSVATQAEQIDLPERYVGEFGNETTSIPAQWWQLFEDRELATLIEQSLQRNQDLAAASSRVDQAMAATGQARADLFPQLSLSGNAQRQKSLSNAYQASDYINLPAQLSFEIDLWGKVRKATRAAKADADATASLYQAAQLSIAAQVAETLFAWRASMQEERIVQASVLTRSDARDLIESRRDLGNAAEIDLARAETQLANAQADLAAVRQRSARLKNALAVLSGAHAPGFDLLKLGATLPEPISLAPGLPSAMLAARPDVAAAEQALSAAAERIGVAKTAFYPNISLTGSAGWESADFDSALSSSTEVWSLGPRLYLPIFQGGRNKARLAKARAAFDERHAVFKQRLLVALQEVQDALTVGALLEDQLRAAQRAANSAAAAAQLSRARYDNGFVSYLEVVDSERVSLTAQRQVVRLQAQRLSNSVTLIRSLGGGIPPTPRT